MQLVVSPTERLADKKSAHLNLNLKCYYDQKVTLLLSLSFENISLYYLPCQVSNQSSYRKSDYFNCDLSNCSVQRMHALDIRDFVERSW